MSKFGFNTSLDKDVNRLIWESGKREKLLSSSVFDVSQIERKCRDKSGKFIYIDAPDWVVVIPVYESEDGEKRVIVEKQYRHGSDSITLEYPAGVIERGEEPLEAAKRELLEETGLTSSKITFLGSYTPNSALFTNKQYCFLAEGLTKVSSQSLDQNEEIEVFDIPLSLALDLIVDNGLMASASFLLLKEERRRSKSF